MSSLADQRGSLVIVERTASAGGPGAATERWLESVRAVGGGRLVDAIRRDDTGAARRLLSRAVWMPDLAACLALQPTLPAGWVAVVRDGSPVVDEVGMTPGTTDSPLHRPEQRPRLGAQPAALDETVARARDTAEAATSAAATARADPDSAREAEALATAERRRAEDAERVAAREHEAIVREAAWSVAQLARAEADLARAGGASERADRSTDVADAAASTPSDDDQAALASWESRAAELRERRDRLAARLGDHDAERRAAEHARARSEASAANADERVRRAESEAARLTDRRAAVTAERDRLAFDLAAASQAEARARDALATLHAADATDRSRLSDAERLANAARERLRSADERLRAADRAELEARLGLDGLRESILIELAGLGPVGRVALGLPAGYAGMADDESGTDVAAETADLETAITEAAQTWASAPPPVSPPSAGRLAQLRRRYHELGAANPFAVDEYAELKTRLETLETQRSDLAEAIASTRALIGELDVMIADQFQSTFRALESAFERRFELLFGGGFARLSLTDPSDLGSTGIEIVARPPGKKPQALAMLSGGERALTAVALLFAMLEVRPVPFCVLDEVDAALDEANIGRFAESLRSLAHQTQFIVITHNRGTIEAADALYGVTVGDDSVSRVISLRLDEAQELAARQGRELSVAG